MSGYRRPRWRTAAALLSIAVVSVGLAACSDDSSSGSGTSDPSTSSGSSDSLAETRRVETALGSVDVPVAPERILALDEYAALNMMALGVEPTEVWASYQSEVGAEMIGAAGITLTEAAIDSGVNIEAVAESAPDLIVVTAEGPFVDALDDVKKIAPTVVLSYSLPWRDMINETANVFDRADEAAALIAALEGRVGELTVAEPGPTLSLLGNTYGMLFGASKLAPISGLIEELGYGRPAAQLEGEPDPTFDAAVMLSDEVLDDHDADLVVVFTGAYYDSASIEASAAFQALPAVQAGRTVTVDGDMWFATYPFAVFWILEDIAAIQADDPAGIGTAADSAERLAAFEALTK